MLRRAVQRTVRIDFRGASVSLLCARIRRVQAAQPHGSRRIRRRRRVQTRVSSTVRAPRAAAAQIARSVTALQMQMYTEASEIESKLAL